MHADNLFSRQQRITNCLLLNASFIDNLGLMHGKMGIAIYFCHLARETENQIYEDYAGELIDEIYEEINSNTPLDFENGLAGIGWGIEYLVQKGFIEADTDEVLEEFDNRLFQQLIYHTPNEVGLLNGLVGLGAYFLKRIQNPNANDQNIKNLTNKQTLIHLIDVLEQRLTDEEIEKLLNGKNETIETHIEQSKKETKGTFNLTWDYPVLLWFLEELHVQNIFNFKIEKIIHRLISPLINERNWPTLHSYRLLLVLVLEKMKNCNIELLLYSFYDESIQKLLAEIDKEAIAKELAPDSVFMQDGTGGIAWIYKQLFDVTREAIYQQETVYWTDRFINFDNTDSGYAGYNVPKEKEQTGFGLLEGLAGIALIAVKTKISNVLQTQP